MTNSKTRNVGDELAERTGALSVAAESFFELGSKLAEEAEAIARETMAMAEGLDTALTEFRYAMGMDEESTQDNGHSRFIELTSLEGLDDSDEEHEQPLIRASGELSDEELAALAGGQWPFAMHVGPDHGLV